MSDAKVSRIKYEDPVEFSVERALEKIEFHLEGDYAISKRAIGLLLLQEDKDIENIVREKEKDKFDVIKEIVNEAKEHYANPLDYIITMRRQKEASDIAREVLAPVQKVKVSFKERLSQITMNPITGIPILFLILYWGLYKFVGEFGAGTVVDFWKQKYLKNI